MLTKRSVEGELMIDERACGGRLVESATITCSHCNRVFLRNHDRVRPRKYCSKCDHYICDLCDERECMPVRKMLDLIQEDAFRKESGHKRVDLLQEEAFRKAIERQMGIAAFRKSIE